MKKILAAAALVGAVALPSVALAADLESFLRSVDARAKSDVRNFNQMLSQQFGVPVPNVEAIMKSVPRPADAFMILHVSQTTHQDPERVLRTYQEHGGKGWGVVAQRMGIKPGSPEFHALKRGDLVFSGQARHGHDMDRDDRDDEREEHGHGNGRGRGRGH